MPGSDDYVIDGRVAPRSGLASKHFIDTGAGVIDADYRGEVKVLLFNHAETDFTIAVGERVAQLVLERVCLTPRLSCVMFVALSPVFSVSLGLEVSWREVCLTGEGAEKGRGPIGIHEG